jgi:hypothetical protein
MPRPNTQPPALALRILTSLLPDFSREAILGDLHETYAQIRTEIGAARADRWFWRETLGALPRFTLHAMQNTNFRRQIVSGNIWNENWFGKQDSRVVAGIGFVVLLPALVLVSLAMVWFNFGPATFNKIPGAAQLMEWMETGYMQLGSLSFPIGILIMGSLLLTVLVTALAIMKINIERDKDNYRFTFTIKPKAWSVILAVLVVVLGLGLDWLIS